MELIRDTPLEHGALFWPIRPPRASMIVVSKATFELPASGPARLAAAQDPVTGHTYWDDEPSASLRWPSELAPMKPRGECFVVGSCRPLTGRSVTQTVASFSVGAVSKRIAVYGDRRWSATGPSAPAPFTEMPLRWERTFGGAGHAANPVGRGIDASGGEVWLPNLELEGRTITDRAQRPPPAAPGPIAMTWESRRALAGTYDERWQRERWPWLPDDFRYAFYEEAPLDQRIEGYWRGDEAIALVHLHPQHARVESALPRLLPRAFVEREGGAFDEVGLVLDTITIDADRGLAMAVWRGAIELDHERLAPDGIARLFTMHEDLSAPSARASSIEACRARMQAKLALEVASSEERAGVAPPEASVDRTLVDVDTTAVREAAAQAEAAERARAEADAALGRLKRQLGDLGVDPAKLADDAPTTPAEPPDLEKLRAAYAAMDAELPEELVKLIEAMGRPEPKPPAAEAAPAARDLRALVMAAHASRARLVGDFTGARLDGLSLAGLDARDAILVEASFRGADLSGAKLDGATLIRADFLGANLSDASLRGADLSEAVLEKAKLRSARLDRASLERAELQEADLEEASLRGADLTRATLDGASFASVICDGAFFTGASMKGCRFARASLEDARLYGVSGEKIVLERAKLAKVRVGRGADLRGASIRQAEATGSHWREAILDGADLTGTALDDADFSGASLRDASLRGCSLRRARFQDAILEGSTLAEADVFEGTFRAAALDRADLRNANLYCCNFFQARGTGVVLDGANLDGTRWRR